MGKATEAEKVIKPNLGDQIAEVRIAQIVKEEEELEAKDESIKTLKANTAILLDQMAEAAEAGNEELRRDIRNQVIVDNLRLVTQVLKKYGYFSPDKFQNGCIGMLKAADTFKAERGVPFGNYAAFCIEIEIRSAFKKTNRMFESKAQGFLGSLDQPSTMGNGDSMDQHEMIEDPFAHQDFDDITADAEAETLFYNIIIPTIRTYGQRAKDIDLELWQTLEIQYFVELSLEKSQRQRITFTEMARQLGSTPQNMRSRHKKVLELIQQACIDNGYLTHKGAKGQTNFYKSEEAHDGIVIKHSDKKHKKGNY